MGIVAPDYQYVVGVDTHSRSHTLAIIDAATAAEIDVAQFPSTPAGAARRISWITRRTKAGTSQILVSMEGVNSYGSGPRE